MMDIILEGIQTFCIAGAITCLSGCFMLVYYLIKGKEF